MGRTSHLTCLLFLISTSTLSSNQTNTTSNLFENSTRKALSCYLADASTTTSKYFVTGNLVYLATVNVVLPVLSGFVLPIVLAKLTASSAPALTVPAKIVPVGQNLPTASTQQVTKIWLGIPTAVAVIAAMKEPVSIASGFVAGSEWNIKILDSQSIPAALSPSATAFYGGMANFLQMYSRNKNPTDSSSTSSNSGTGVTASGLSAQDIINISLALISFAAWTWNQVQQALCSNDSQA